VNGRGFCEWQAFCEWQGLLWYIIYTGYSQARGAIHNNGSAIHSYSGAIHSYSERHSPVYIALYSQGQLESLQP